MYKNRSYINKRRGGKSSKGVPSNDRNGRNDNKNTKRRQSVGGSWNKMATWYDGMVGSKGHKYHQEYAIPTIMKLLNVKKDQNILDVGCGQGVLRQHITNLGGNYYGVDISENMIKSAIKMHGKNGKGGRFFVGSADSLNLINELQNVVIDTAVFMLSIQDMKPLDKIVSAVAHKLKSGGTLVIFMLHPAFRIPRQSGWGEDKRRKLIYRRVDRYLSEDTIPLNTNIKVKGERITSYFYHRPLSKYFEELFKNNLAVVQLLEISEDKKGYGEFPTFLAIKCTRN